MTSVYIHAKLIIIWLEAERQAIKEASGFFTKYIPVLCNILLAKAIKDFNLNAIGESIEYL